MFKINVQKRKKVETVKYKKYKGIKVFSLPAGSIVRCVGPLDNSNVGDILLRTATDVRPLMTLVSGPKGSSNVYTVWGDCINYYTFEYIHDKTIKDYV
jgi:hypothetical protein